MNLIDAIRESWGWTGVEPEEVVKENAFGNLLIRDVDGRFWRLCPEDLYCEVIAQDQDELDGLFADPEFLEDWRMEELVRQAEEVLGPLGEDQKYCLVIPGVLGGEYSVSNIARLPLGELIAVSGDLAKQIADVPDGGQVRLEIVD
ncbi:MAG: DUF1851 domain-containing protein [Acidobacteriota bacterium]|nr:MAG: DUF1851 domain-containing protein [Acidobacteriota bacterium]